MGGKVNNRGMREVNRALVLDLIRRAERTSRSEIARASKLTKPTVGAIVEGLLSAGVIREIGPDNRGAGVGRKARLLELNDASAAYLSIHFSVGQTQVAIADALGEILVVEQKAHRSHDPDEAMQTVKELVRKGLKVAKVPKTRVQAAGVVIPGLVDQRSGECVLAPNLGWERIPLRDMTAAALGVPVSVHNITQAAALAEARVGAARGLGSFVWVYAGTGVGASFVFDGELYLGRRGFSGEIGHCRVEDAGVLCRCGHRGCLETRVAEPGVLRELNKALAERTDSVLANPDKRNLIDLIAAARGGDALARRVLGDAGTYLGLGLSFLANLLNVPTFVIGGRIAEAGDVFLDAAQQSLCDNALLPNGLRVIQSELAQSAGLRGGVFAALELHQRAPRVVGGRAALS
ncbi:MAG: hypothetical protein RJA70_461 [Pseudomonadota bacterium]|jgi:predicted NBD/HSP70 family sugar kinase